MTLLAMATKTAFEPVGVVITTILTILVIVNVIGNSLVCAAIIKNHDMRYVHVWHLCYNFNNILQRVKLLYRDCVSHLQVSLKILHLRHQRQSRSNLRPRL